MPQPCHHWRTTCECPLTAALRWRASERSISPGQSWRDEAAPSHACILSIHQALCGESGQQRPPHPTAPVRLLGSCGRLHGFCGGRFPRGPWGRGPGRRSGRTDVRLGPSGCGLRGAERKSRLGAETGSIGWRGLDELTRMCRLG